MQNPTATGILSRGVVSVWITFLYRPRMIGHIQYRPARCLPWSKHALSGRLIWGLEISKSAPKLAPLPKDLLCFRSSWWLVSQNQSQVPSIDGDHQYNEISPGVVTASRSQRPEMSQSCQKLDRNGNYPRGRIIDVVFWNRQKWPPRCGNPSRNWASIEATKYEELVEDDENWRLWDGPTSFIFYMFGGLVFYGIHVAVYGLLNAGYSW